MNCGTLKGFMSHKAANTPPCKWCAPYNPKLTTPKKEVVVSRARPKAKPAPKPRPTSQAACGTTAGFHRHRTAKETPCDPCREAVNKYQRDRYQAAEAKPKQEPQHGTAGGRTQHIRRKEPVCDPCRLAFNKATSDRYHAKKAANQ